MIHFSKLKIAIILGICLLGVVFALPNLLSAKQAQRLPAWLPGQQISLGLDLQGGSHLLLEVEVDTVIRERLEALVDSMRTALRQARIRYSGLGMDGLSAKVTVLEPERAEDARQLLKNLDSGTTVELTEGGTIRLALTEQLHKLGLDKRVLMPGNQRDVLPWLRALDVFVLPSICEGHSLSINEAWLAGVPVVVSDFAWTRELGERHGVGTMGVVVPLNLQEPFSGKVNIPPRLPFFSAPF